MITVEYSSMCLTEANCERKIREASGLFKRGDLRFGIQIHNSVERGLFDRLMAFSGDIPFSLHSPVFSEHFINLAYRDFPVMEKIFRDILPFLKKIQSNLFLFHGFFMTQELIRHDMKNYRGSMKNNIPARFSLNNSFIMNPEYFQTDEFLEYRSLFIENYRKVKALFPAHVICPENDFVGIGSGIQRPLEIMELLDDLWFDLGHFWCSSLLHKFDFYEESERIMSEKKIHGVHVNHNLMTRSTRVEELKDSHTHLYEKSEQELKPLVRRLREKGVRRFTLEVLDGDAGDLEILLDWLGA